jgi:putative ABC transport system permease protein
MVPWRQVLATHEMVSADTFRALGIKLVGGRGISSADGWSAPKVAVVNRALASQHFQHGEALGRQLMIGLNRSDWYTVVGVVEDQTPSGLGGALQPPYTVYLSLLQHPIPEVDLLLRTTGHPESTDPEHLVQGTLGISPGGVARTSESALLSRDTGPLAWFGRWFGFEGWVSLVIALTGTFALMRLWVVSLSGELGLRRSVGARRRHIIGWVCARACIVGLAGTAAGLWFGPAVWEALSSVVTGLPGWDGAIVARLALLLVGTTMAAALYPAWRAANAGPAQLMGSRD